MVSQSEAKVSVHDSSHCFRTRGKHGRRATRVNGFAPVQMQFQAGFSAAVWLTLAWQPGNQHEPSPTHPIPATSSVASVLTLTRGFLRTQLWVWPLVAALVLAFIGVWLRVKMEGATKQQIADTLQTILNANTEALRSWSVTMKSDAENLAEDDRVRELVAGLIQQAKSSTAGPGGVADGAAAFRIARPSETRARTPRLQRVRGAGHEFSGGRLEARPARGHAIAARQRGDSSPRAWLARALVTRPFPSVALLPDRTGQTARRRAHHVCRRPHPVGRRPDHRRAGIAHRAGHGLHAHPRHSPRRPDRRDLCLRSRRQTTFRKPLRQRSQAPGIDSGRAGRALDPDPGVARSAGGSQPGTPVAQTPHGTAVHPCR